MKDAILDAGIPAECWPTRAKGEQSYTLEASNGSRIEVQVLRNAFYIVRPVPADGVSRRVGWCNHVDIATAWAHAKQVAQWCD